LKTAKLHGADYLCSELLNYLPFYLLGYLLGYLLNYRPSKRAFTSRTRAASKSAAELTPGAVP
jgi:hypothetical protein